MNAVLQTSFSGLTEQSWDTIHCPAGWRQGSARENSPKSAEADDLRTGCPLMLDRRQVQILLRSGFWPQTEAEKPLAGLLN
jgi:hypothetical protein